MKPKEPVKTGQHDMFRSRLDQIIDLGHEKVVLADQINGQFLSGKCGENYTDKPGHPALSFYFSISLIYSNNLVQKNHTTSTHMIIRNNQTPLILTIFG